MIDLNNRKKDIDETKENVKDLLIIAVKALQGMKKMFKQQKPYEDLIKKYNQQLALQLNKRR